jgi:hypothetical protein
MMTGLDLQSQMRHLFVLTLLSERLNFGRVPRFLTKINVPHLSKVKVIAFNSFLHLNTIFKQRNHASRLLLTSNVGIILHLTVRGNMRGMAQDRLELYLIPQKDNHRLCNYRKQSLLFHGFDGPSKIMEFEAI